MAGENVTTVADATKDKDADGESRQRSTIAFPYNNLDDAIEVARAIHSHVGTGEGDDAQVSAWMNLSPKSSGFRVQMSAARMFGLIESGTSGYRLSQLGRMIVDPQREREARSRAFLNVPLYRALYDHHKTDVLPPTAALEREIVGLGVAEKQRERARQVFERSADQAGFFEHGRTRLVMPGIAASDDDAGATGRLDAGDEGGKGKGNGGDGGDGGDLGLDPLIGALVKKLPKPGADWSLSERVVWLKMMAMAFNMTYATNDAPDEGIEVKKVEAAN